VNSYKRLVPGYEAPTAIVWSERNRSPMARVPDRRGPGTRVEIRMPDPSCNPYLAFAVMLAAGLKGIEGKYPLAEPVEHDVYEMDEKARAKAGIVSLPGNLFEALQEVRKSTLVREALGDHIFNKFIENKVKEWDLYRIHVTDFELKRYLPML